NIDPELQLDVLAQMKGPRLVAGDTMNLWIETKRAALEACMRQLDILIINEEEVREFSGEYNLVKAAQVIRKLGPKILLIKRGEYGVLMFTPRGIFAVSGYPLEVVFDPTGAGDTFAGGFFGYLARTGDHSEANLRKAVVFGSVIASFSIEAFSLDRLKTLTWPEIEARYREFHALTHFEREIGEVLSS
ncbi:MAG: sugar kinase, partial [Deltaproteobacteria bacterium]